MAQYPGAYKPRQPGTLKASYAELVERCRGQDRAAELTGLSQSTIQRITDPDSANRNAHFKVPDVRALQAASGCMVVTEFLAAEQGYLLFRPLTDADAGNLPQDLAAVGEQVGRLFAEFAAAMGNDGRVDAREAARMLDAGDGMVARYMAARSQLKARIREADHG
ncbi:MAG TPA: phage regulatory CII family protein [Azospirillum sp.]|nr:phage regulatory CII family protein [Azospirillum sp.]